MSEVGALSLFRERDIHPCFFCTLPDCDEGSPFCELRVVQRLYNRAYFRKRRYGEEPSNFLKAQNAIAYRELHLGARREKRASA